MGNRVFVGIVVVLWGGAMSWLMVARILPPFFHGEPPTQGALIPQGPACWEIHYGGRVVGHAVSQAVPGALSTTEIHSRVLFNNIDIKELAPQWMGGLVRALGEVSLDIRSNFVLDTLGNLANFSTKVRVNDLPTVMRVDGKVDDAQLRMRFHSGEIAHEVGYPIPAGTQLTNEMVPDSKLLQVYVGRKWQQEVYNPFRPPGNSLEILQAEVKEERWFEHRGERYRAKKIEYRSLSTAGVSTDNTLSAVVWVAEDGMVLCQDIFLMNVKLRFERCTEPEMIELAERLLDIESVATIPHHASSRDD
ncbi:MAG: hypothetical protein IT425_08650 [Pirellulales bacterium]|nr:hypothetical protein [Pirellulales bacterium]